MKNKKTLIELLVILVLGLIPSLWFRGNEVILGHDAGLTLAPVTHFLDRLYTWTERFGFGNDQTNAIPGFFIHGLEAFIGILGFNVQQNQIITFIFWFMLPGLSMYYFTRNIEKRYKLSFFALPASLFYMFNHFLLQGWFIAERTKFSLYAALPLLIAFLLDWEEGRKSTLQTALLVSLTFFFLNGLASIPLFGGILSAVISFFFYYFLRGITKIRIIKLAKLFLLFISISIFLQSYWLFPFSNHVMNSYSASVEFFGGYNGILGWIKYISENSSYTNLFRLQGVPEWYQNPDHPYAKTFLENTVLIIVSFLIPISAFSALYLSRKKKIEPYILLFAGLALISLIFVAGSHPPFGAFYLLLVQYVPGFIAFRTPFYKFSPALWFSYALLISYTIHFCISFISLKKKILAHIIYIFLLFGILAYSYPFFTGGFFDYIQGKRSMRVKVPEYIYDYGAWSEKPERYTKKTLVLPAPNPESNVEAYTWGYWSLAPLTSLLSNSPHVNRNIFLTKDEQTELLQVFQLMKKNDPNWEKAAKMLGITSFLIRRDFDFTLKESPTDTHKMYESAIRSKKNIKKVAEFGAWVVYDFIDNTFPNNKYISYFVGDASQLINLTTLPAFTDKEDIIVETQNKEIKSELLKKIDTFYIQADCITCDLQWKFINQDEYIPLLTRGSVFYPIIDFAEQLKEKRQTAVIRNKALYYSEKVMSNFLAFRKQVDEHKKTQAIELTGSDISYSMQKLTEAVTQYQKVNHESETEDLIAILSSLRILRTITAQTKESLLSYADNNSAKLLTNKIMKHEESLKSLYSLIDNNLWRTKTLDEKRLLLSVPSAGEYEVFYQSKDNNLQNEENVLIIINNQQLQTTGYAGWNNAGKVDLEEGISQVSILQPTQNLVDQLGIIEFGENGSCYKSRLFDGQRNDLHFLSFEHLKTGKNDKFTISLLRGDIYDEKSKEEIVGETLTSLNTFRKYTNMYMNSTDKGFYFQLCPVKKNNTKFIIRNPEVKKIAVPEIILRKTDNSNKLIVNRKLEKVNQTRYTVRDAMLSVIALDETASVEWQMQGCENKKLILNGHVNGWLIDQNNKDCEIIYYPQQIFMFGTLVSGITFFTTTVYYLKKYGKKN